MSSWSGWSKCSIDCGLPEDGIQMRTRSILKEPALGGAKCPTDLEHIRACVDIQPCCKYTDSQSIRSSSFIEVNQIVIENNIIDERKLPQRP